MALDDTNHGSGGGGGDDGHHNETAMKAASNTLLVALHTITEQADICPACTLSFSLGRLAGYLLWQRSHDEDGKPTEPNGADTAILIGMIGIDAMAEWQRLIDTGGDADGPVPKIRVL